jgi:hypothetical protein
VCNIINQVLSDIFQNKIKILEDYQNSVSLEFVQSAFKSEFNPKESIDVVSFIITLIERLKRETKPRTKSSSHYQGILDVFTIQYTYTKSCLDCGIEKVDINQDFCVHFNTKKSFAI